MMHSLKRYGIAHGDLQHDNIIIEKDDLITQRAQTLLSFLSLDVPLLTPLS